MAKQRKLWLVGALLLVVVGGSVVASNMGFKFVPNIGTASDVYTVALPINNNYSTANSIFNDMVASGCSPTSIARIQPSPGASVVDTWLGPGGGTNFGLTLGQGVLVQTTAPCTSWVIVGSHDPTFPFNIATASEWYMVSIPYHTTAQTANDIFVSLPNASSVIRVQPSPGASVVDTWLGPGGGTNFPVAIGQAYAVTVSAPSPSWIPAHY